MRLTVERALDADTIAAFYPLYVAAFSPLLTRSAARHMLTAQEFASEMADERIDKYLVWNDDGFPVALTTVATDLSAVPWVSPEFFAARYPNAYERGAILYLGFTLVVPEYQRQRTFTLMLEPLWRRIIDSGSVLAYDICAYNDSHGFGRRVLELCQAGNATVDLLDVQTFYAANCSGEPPSGDSQGEVGP